MENDICDLARAVTVGFETIFEAFNALAEACEKFFACATDLFGDIEEQFSKAVLKNCVLTTRTSAKSDGWIFPIKLCKEESGGFVDD